MSPLAATPSPSMYLGLQNRPGDNMCFLNGVVQVLFRLRILSKPFMSAPHRCSSKDESGQSASPCLVCALRGVFGALAGGERDTDTRQVRAALSALGGCVSVVVCVLL